MTRRIPDPAMSATPPHLAAVLAALLLAVAAQAGELVGPGTISTGLQETSVALTPDGDTLYFMRSDFSESDDTLLVSHRRGGRWSAPEVAPFSGRWHDSEPTLSPDGQRLYFVSNRPPHAGGAPVTASMGGHSFAGTNLWYVARQADGRWGEPVHVDGALNDGAMIYNPSVAANGDIYFSAHRADSGAAYQIYVVHPRKDGYSVPERQELGEPARNRMDPAIDPRGRFLIYAGDALWVVALAIMFGASRQAWSRTRPGERLKLPIGEVGRGLALWALPGAAFAFSRPPVNSAIFPSVIRDMLTNGMSLSVLPLRP